MSNEQGYRGWANYPTWAVALWIDNDGDKYETLTDDHPILGFMAVSYPKPGMYTEVHELTRDVMRQERSNEYATVEYDLAAALKDYVEERAPDLEATLYSDLLEYAIDEVEWRELANHYLQSVKEQDND